MTHPDAAANAALTEFLREAAVALAPLAVEDTTFLRKYGTLLRVEGAGAEIQMKPYCWCDATDCPWCATASVQHAAAELEMDAGLLAEQWAQAHVIDGLGAPNFRFADSQGTLSVFWYKSIGRGMEIHPAMTAGKIRAVAERFRIWARTQQRRIARAQLAGLGIVDFPGLDPETTTVLLRALDTRLGGTARLSAEIAAVRRTLAGLQDASEAAHEAREMEAALDRAGVPAASDPEMEDLGLKLRPSWRLGQMLAGEAAPTAAR